MYKNPWDSFQYWKRCLGFVDAYKFIKQLRDQYLELKEEQAKC